MKMVWISVKMNERVKRVSNALTWIILSVARGIIGFLCGLAFDNPVVWGVMFFWFLQSCLYDARRLGVL